MVMSVAEAHATYMAAMHRGDRKRLKPRTLYDKRGFAFLHPLQIAADRSE